MGKFESKFDIYLNTEDPAIVRNMIDKYPFAGVCCNLQMVSRLGRPDFANIVKELREATGERKLFIQTPSNDYDGIMRDAEAILKISGDPTVIKIPCTSGGIQAMQQLAGDIDICGTQVMSTLQGVCALQAGAKYVATFFCFMQMGGADEYGLYGGVDAKAVYSALTKFIEVSGSEGRIMACAPRTPDELSYLISTGATSIALDPIDFDNCFNARHFINLNHDVRNSWESVYGNKNAYDLI